MAAFKNLTMFDGILLLLGSKWYFSITSIINSINMQCYYLLCSTVKENWPSNHKDYLLYEQEQVLQLHRIEFNGSSSDDAMNIVYDNCCFSILKKEQQLYLFLLRTYYTNVMKIMMIK